MRLYVVNLLKGRMRVEQEVGCATFKTECRKVIVIKATRVVVVTVVMNARQGGRPDSAKILFLYHSWAT